MQHTYAIGDIHGCQRTFSALLEYLQLREGDRLVLLGDYIDRGPDSRAVIDTIFQRQAEGCEVICLRGNHEQMLLDAIEHPTESLEFWLRNGGRQTLASFGADRLRDIPERYIEFFRNTLFYYETEGYICLHGGPNFAHPDPLEQPADLLWMRRWYADIRYAWLDDRIILHGHTPVGMDIIRQQYAALAQQQYLNLDNGCVYATLGGKGEDLGCLMAFCLETKALRYQSNVE
ncbi:MAG: serine/threonine protein phosphatase [Saprospiraceae bacterium]|nr:serine/threonine protein phosphatase [Saprospiraceae bacterium]